MRVLAFIFCIVFLCPAASAQKTGPALNHIALHVQDLKRSTEFYRQVVQLDTIPEPFRDGKHTWFTLGAGGQLHLISGAGPMTHNKNTHLCFSTPSLDSFIQNLTRLAVPYEDWNGKKNSVTTRVDKVRQIYFQDPDNYWIEVNDDFKR
ncbi:MAG TPA: VOC family protein [Chitinophagaceae bacterium]